MAGHVPKESAKAAEAFAAYVAMGPNRSHAKLARKMGKVSGYVRQLERWSGWYRWQERLAQAVTNETERRLSEAAELNADTYLAICREYNTRTKDAMIAAWSANDLHPILDRVKPSSKTSATIEHKHSGTIAHNHLDLNVFTDDEIDHLAALSRRVKTERDAV